MVSRAAAREAADLQATRDREHAARLRAATRGDDAALAVVFDILLERAADVQAAKRKGWQSRFAALTTSAAHIADLRALLDANPAPTVDPPHRPPLDDIPRHGHADLDPTDGPVSAQIARRIREQIDAESTVDAKLDVAFGEPSPPTLAAPEPVQASWISAAFPGQCSGCGDFVIDVGDDIRSDGAGGWQKRDCCEGETVSTLPDRPDRPGRHIRRLPADAADPQGSAENFCGGYGGLAGPREGATCTACVREYDIDHPPEPALTLAAPDPFANAPTSQRRLPLTLAEVAAHGRARARGADHRSHSQITGFEECGVRYALSDRERRPAWWNVGGTAVHKAVEAINRYAMTGDILEAVDVAGLWRRGFAESVAMTEYQAGVPHEQWRAAARGSEAYDWWRVSGEEMVGRWVEYLRRRYVDGWAVHAIEQSYRLPVDGVPVPVECVIDVVFERDGTYDIIDVKAGKSAPRDGFQIGGLYHWALWYSLNMEQPERFQAPGQPDVTQSFWLARQADPVNQELEIAVVPWSDVVHRVSMMDRAERQGLYVARPSNFCGSCEVNDLCPVGPRS